MGDIAIGIESVARVHLSIRSLAGVVNLLWKYQTKNAGRTPRASSPQHLIFNATNGPLRSKGSDLCGKALDGLKTQAGSIGNRLGRDSGTKKVNRI